jgi:hypothetical protein
MLIASLLTSSVQSIAYLLCDESNYIYSGKAIETVLSIGPSQSVTVNGQVKGITVTGKLRVRNGCEFEMEGFSFSGPPTAQWFNIVYPGTEGFRERWETGPICLRQC